MHRTTKTLTIGLSAGAVRLGVLDGRRVALDTHPQREAEVKSLFVGQAELMGQLVDADLLRQRLLLSFVHFAFVDSHMRASILAHHRAWSPFDGSEALSHPLHLLWSHGAPKSP